MKPIKLAIVMVFALFVLAACGNSNQAEEPASGDGAQTLDITASNFEFDKDTYTVEAGKPVNVTLTNKDGMHGIGISSFDVSIKGEGEASFTPEEPGEYTIRCNVMCGAGHSDMVSTLVVE